MKNSRPYPDDEIRVMYRQAKNRKEQLRILTDMNLCSVAEIQKIVSTPQEVSTMKDKINYEAAIAEVERGQPPEMVAPRFGTTVANINRARGQRKRHEAAREARAEQPPIVATVPNPTAAYDDDMTRISSILDWIRPDDSDEIKGAAKALVRELVTQTVNKVLRMRGGGGILMKLYSFRCDTLFARATA